MDVKNYGIKTISVFPSTIIGSRKGQINKSILTRLKDCAFIFTPSICNIGDKRYTYAVFNMSLNMAKKLNAKCHNSSFVYSQINTDGSIHSELFEIEDDKLPYNRKTNGYVVKSQADEHLDVIERNNGFDIIGNGFNYTIPLSIFENVNRSLYDNATRFVTHEHKKYGSNISEEWLIDQTINGVGYSVCRWRKALTINLGN